jgi:hypothetical protein
MGSKRSGRGGRFNATVAATIIGKLKLGAHKAHAALSAKISPRTLEDWLERGRAGDKKYAEFAADVDAAMADIGIRLQVAIMTAAIKGHVGDWKAAAWDLERRFPKLYGRQAEPMVGVTFGGGGDGEDEDGAPQKTRVEFYIPDNGRRPVEET